MSTKIKEINVSKRPEDTAFKQQKLKAWQPLLTPGSVLPIMLAIAVSFIPIGICLIVVSNNIVEFELDYTDENCKPIQEDQQKFASCMHYIKDNVGSTCSCYIQFNLSEDMQGDVYLYYGLTKYYQNHRHYVKSRDDRQLFSLTFNYNDLSMDCHPFRGVPNASLPGGGKAYAPCGIIANSLFNDTFELFFENNKTNVQVNWLNTNIAWTSDRISKFKNPPEFYKNQTEAAFKDTIRLPNWQKSIFDLDEENVNNNGYENEDLIVWMRTATFPNFRKLYRRLDRNIPDFEDGLPSGVYKLLVNYSYPTWSFEGRKLIFLTTTSWMGGKNIFLGVVYVIVGCICLVLSFIFILLHCHFIKRRNTYTLNERTSL